MFDLNQSITYWAKSGNTGDGENFAAGVVIDGKYAERSSVVQDASGNDVLSTHRVYTATDIEEGSYIYLGAYGGDLSTKPDDASQIIKRHSNASVIGLYYFEI